MNLSEILWQENLLGTCKLNSEVRRFKICKCHWKELTAVGTTEWRRKCSIRFHSHHNLISKQQSLSAVHMTEEPKWSNNHHIKNLTIWAAGRWFWTLRGWWWCIVSNGIVYFLWFSFCFSFYKNLNKNSYIEVKWIKSSLATGIGSKVCSFQYCVTYATFGITAFSHPLISCSKAIWVCWIIKAS